MPYIIGTRRVRKIAFAAFTATLLIGVLPAVANAECPSQPTSVRFESSGDNSEYFAVPGGTFEEGAPGWWLDNAAVEPETQGPEGSSGALVIQPGGVAVSPAICVSSSYPSFRFFAQQLSGEGALNVSLRWPGPFGFIHQARVGSLQGEESWALSPALELARKLPLWMGNTLKVQLVFESARPSFNERQGGTWAIDDVYVDPYRR